MSIVIRGAHKIDAAGETPDFWMLLEGQTITATGTGTAPGAGHVIEADGAILTPGFIDLHCHGGGGSSFEDGPDGIYTAIEAHRRHGTTRTLVSLVANPVDELVTSLGVIATIAENDPLVLGSHLEGPYLSPEKLGAHNADYLHFAEHSEIERMIAAGRGTLAQMTLAPELPGGFEAIEQLVAAGVTVGVGHTTANYELTRQAFDLGARLLTHAFNAMPGIHHRAPGPVVAAFADDRVILELIFDGEHMHADVAKLAFSSAPGRVALITDAMAAAAFVDGDFRLGSLDVSVSGGVALIAGTRTLAGSTLTQDAALRRAVAAGVSRVDAVAALTTTPARVVDREGDLGMLSPGYAADAVLLETDLSVRAVWGAGRRLA